MNRHPHSEETKEKIRQANRGDKNYGWKGGVVDDCYGYKLVKIYDHPHGNSRNYVREHRLVMEKHLGRYLESHELVHHKNGNRSDNRLENLEIVLRSHHFGEVKCPHCQNTFKIK